MELCKKFREEAKVDHQQRPANVETMITIYNTKQLSNQQDQHVQIWLKYKAAVHVHTAHLVFTVLMSPGKQMLENSSPGGA